MTEDELQTAVIQLAQMYGWKAMHIRAARTDKGWRTPVQADGKGYPDLTMARGKRLVFAELKSEKGKLSMEQAAWFESLLATSSEIYVWRPSDLERIAKILR